MLKLGALFLEIKMTEITVPNASSLSRLGPRGTLGLTLLEISKTNPRVLALSADLAVTAGLDRFRKTLPGRFINVGIAEQNLVGVASGLANEGWIPFATTFANFAAFRANEFIRHHLGYMQRPVIVVGIGAGFAMGQFGTTHYSLEDIGALRSIPNLLIASPADCSELVQMLSELAKNPRPTYLRLSGAPGMPIVNQAETKFEFGKIRVLESGKDVTLLATGSMVNVAHKASKNLNDLGIRTGVLNVHTLKPIDTETISKETVGRKLVVTIEEHNIIGGLGSATSETLSSMKSAPPLLRIGVPDQFPSVGSYDFVLSQVGLTPQLATNQILDALGNLH